MTRAYLPSTRRGVAVLAATITALATIVLALAVGVGHHDSPAPSAPSQAAAARAATRGYTTVVTVPVFAPGSARPSATRPLILPPMIASTGACKAAMDAVRDLQDANPGGLNMRPAAATKLTALLAHVGPGPGPAPACSDDLAMKFRTQELDPWLLWNDPAVPAAPAAKKVPAAKQVPTPTMSPR